VKEIVGEERLMSAALSFCTSFDAVSTVIPGAVSEAQLLVNIEAMQHRLDDATRAVLDAFFEEEVRALQLPR
jgi:aryl-alcohol dehydrogenase-like predicted oxidoreductase